MNRSLKSQPLKPRKIPIQSRAAETVAAIIEAAAQVLETQGLERFNVAITTSLEEREEQILIQTARHGSRDQSSALARNQIETAISAFPNINFNSEHGRAQRDTLERLGRGGRIALAIGVAGSGKSTLLKAEFFNH